MFSKLIGSLQKQYPALFLVLEKAAIDRAVFYGVSTRVMGVISGPVTVLLVAMKFSSELQGYYYTFANLLALQVFVELGLGSVIIQFASHEWSGLHLNSNGEIAGEPSSLSRLSSLAILAMKWYSVGAMIILMGLGFGGYLFFSQSPAVNVNWVLPWFVLCALTGANICLVPAWSLLEGCNQVSNLYLFRFFEVLFSTLSVWIAIYSGAKLWTASIATAVVIICAGFFIVFKYRRFFACLLARRPDGPSLDWRRDILPLQWRIALSWMSGYFVFSLFTPVLFHYQGPVVAGQFGMTWSLVGFIGSISTAWIAPRVPQFGMLIARRKFNELDELFRRITKIVMLVTVFLGTFCYACVYILNYFKFSLSNRLLSPITAGILILAQAVMTFSIPFSMYLRAHKKEPLMFLSIGSGIAIGVSTMILGKYYSAFGVSLGYLLINILIFPMILLIWQKCRKEWH